MATGEESDDESLGGAEMHARISGLADYFAVDERDAIRIGRRIVARLNWRKPGAAPRSGSRAAAVRRGGAARHRARPTCKAPFDPREVHRPDRRRLATSTSSSRSTARRLVTGWATLHGYPIGILANARGVLFCEESQKATQFIQLANRATRRCCSCTTPPATWSASEYEQGGIIKHGAHDDQRGLELAPSRTSRC